MTISPKRVACQVVAGLSLLFLGAMAVTGCGGSQGEPVEREKTAARDVSTVEEVPITADVEDVAAGGLSLSEATLDYTVIIRCTFAGNSLEKTFKSADVAAGNASMPKGSADCYAFPSEVLNAGSTFLPPTPPDRASFNNYTVGAVMIYTLSPAPADGTTTEAVVRLDKALPKALNGPAAVAYDVDFRRREAVMAVASSITLEQSKLGSTVEGQNPPAFSVQLTDLLAIVSPQPSDKTKCAYQARVTCTTNAQTGADGNMSQCDGVDMNKLTFDFEQDGTRSSAKPLSASDVTRTATSALLPVTIKCDRSGVTQSHLLNNLVLRMYNVADGGSGSTAVHSSRAFPFDLTLNYSLFP